MNINEYISSGILESYVLGSCTSDQQKEVEANALQYPEVRTELEAIREALNNYVLLNEQSPPAHLKEKIAQAVKDSSSANNETKVYTLENKEEINVSRGANGYKLLAAASVALLIAVSAFFYNKLQKTENEVAQLKDQMEGMTHDKLINDSLIALEKKKMEFKLAQMDMVKKPSMVAMPMTGKEKAPDAKVVVYGDSKTNEIFLEVDKLPKAPTGMQYQLWAIVKGKPISAGMVQICEQPDTCGILKMNSIADAHAFAISLEKEGGNESPKGDIFATFGL